MAFDDQSRSEIDATCSALGESLVRRFSCACCRRVWHLIDDERVWKAIEVAERYAEADATLEELDDAQTEVSDAIEDRAREEWEVESEANFCYTSAYCEIAARLYATMAAWYALSRDMSNPDPDPHLAFPDPRKQSSWFWAGAAVESIERSEALRWLEDVEWDDGTNSNCADTTARRVAVVHWRTTDHRPTHRHFTEIGGVTARASDRGSQANHSHPPTKRLLDLERERRPS